MGRIFGECDMMVYCENELCMYCVEGICYKDSITLEMVADWAVCMDAVEAE